MNKEDKPKVGRPKRVFSKEQKDKITEMALNNCHMDTIALALNIPKQTLLDNFRSYIRQKRAEGRTELRRMQRNQAPKSPAMAIFLGKNELGQSDKQDIVLDAGEDLKSFVNWLNGRNEDTKDKG